MRIVKDVIKPGNGLAISLRLIAQHALDRSQRKRENRVAAVLQRRSCRLGMDEFAESHYRRGISKVVRRRQILAQQILRHLNSIDNYAIGTHGKNAPATLPFQSRMITQSSTESSRADGRLTFPTVPSVNRMRPSRKSHSTAGRCNDHRSRSFPTSAGHDPR